MPEQGSKATSPNEVDMGGININKDIQRKMYDWTVSRIRMPPSLGRYPRSI